MCGNTRRLGRGIWQSIWVYKGFKESWYRHADRMMEGPRTRRRLPNDELDPPDRRLPCANSFSGETPVWTAQGARPIATIAVGDQVLAFDETTQTTGLFTVTAIISHTDPAILALLISGERLETTPEHPFFTLERGWVAAGDLWLGAHVRRADGSSGVVQAIVVVRQPQVMYNLTVAGAHTFFVGWGTWLVHNAPCEIPDLSSIDKELGRLARKYGPTSFNCHKCADGMAKAIQSLGYDVDVAHVKTPARKGWMGTLDNRTISTNGWHDLARIKGQPDLFIDAEIYQQRGPYPVTWSELVSFYQDADLWWIDSYRSPK